MSASTFNIYRQIAIKDYYNNKNMTIIRIVRNVHPQSEYKTLINFQNSYKLKILSLKA